MRLFAFLGVLLFHYADPASRDGSPRLAAAVRASTGAHALHALQSVPTCRTAAANCVSRPCSRSGVLEAVVSNAQAQRPSGLRFVRPHDVVSKRTWNAVQAVTDFEAALFKREGWVVLRQVWAPDEDERNGLPPVQPSRVHTLANCEREPPRDEVQYELAAALAARFLRAAALADPAGGSGLDNAYDHLQQVLTSWTWLREPLRLCSCPQT